MDDPALFMPHLEFTQNLGLTPPCKHRVFCSHKCYIHYRFRLQPTLREHEETLTFTRAELEKCFAEWLAELVRSGRVTVNDATLSVPRE